MSINELTAKDPVSTALYINNRFEAFVKFLLSSDDPIGKITKYFFRREYQNRGVPHFHCMFWTDNSPTIGVDSQETIANYIQKYVTCELPTKDNALYNLVSTVQLHKCNSYCKKRSRRKGNAAYCRFKFPREQQTSFKLHDVAKSIAAKHTPSKLRLYELPRKKDEERINDYNPACLYVAKCNLERASEVSINVPLATIQFRLFRLNSPMMRCEISPW